MFPDAMDDLEIAQQVEKECDLRTVSDRDQDADPSLYAPWGKLTYTSARRTCSARKYANGELVKPD
jgi:hypothetical protein